MFSLWHRALFAAFGLTLLVACKGAPVAHELDAGGSVPPATTSVRGAVPFAYPSVPPGGAIGDMCSLDGGTSPGVCAFRGMPLSDAGLIAGNVYAFNGSQWAPTSISGGSYTPIASGNWPQGPPATVAAGLDSLASGATAATHEIVFRPSGTAGGNVYTTWATAYAAGHAVSGPVTMLVDDSASAAHVTTGGPYNLDNWTFLGQQSSNTFTLHIDTGATITSSSIRVGNGLNVQCENTSTACWTPSTFSQLRVDSTAQVASVGASAKPFLQINASATGSQIDLEQATTLGNGTTNAVSVASGQSIFVEATGPTVTGVQAHAFGGAGSVTINRDSATLVSATQDVTSFSIVNKSLASQVAYTPATSANYTQSTPTTTAGALDSLASGATAATTSLVFQPGGTAGGNVYTSWSTLNAATSRVSGFKDVYVDTTLGTAHITAGSWGIDQTRFWSATSAAGILTVDNGVTLTPWTQVELNNVSLQLASGATTAVTVPNGKTTTLIANGTTGGIFAISNPLVHVQSGGAFNAQFYGNMAIGNTGSAVVQADAGGTSSLRFYDSSTLAASTLTGGGAFTVRFADTTVVSTSQAGVTGTLSNSSFANASIENFATTVSSNWPQTAPVITATAIDQIALGATTATHDVVFRPGGTAGGNVYTTWPTAYAALSPISGERTILVDPSLGAAHITTGAWNLDSVTFSTFWNSSGILTIDDGATFTNTFRMRVLGGLVLQSAATHTVWTTSAGNFYALYLDEFSTLKSTTSTPIIRLTGAGAFFYEFSGQSPFIGDGTNPVLTVDTGLTALVYAFDETFIQPHAFTGAGTVNLRRDASSTVGLPQDVTTLTTTLLDQASSVGYTPNVSANWPVGAPSTVSAGLDTAASGGTAATHDLVFKPGGTATGNTYTTSATLWTAASAIPGPKRIEVDTSLGAAHFSGALGDLTDVRIVGKQGGNTVNFDSGTTFTLTGPLYLDSIAVVSAAAAPMLTVGTTELFLYMRGASWTNSTATAPISVAGAGDMAVIADLGSSIGDASHPVFTVGAGKALLTQLYESSQLSAHSVAGAGQLFRQYDASSSTTAQIDITTDSPAILDSASQVSYTPAVSANWNPAPTLVSGALDQLAAPNFVQVTANTGTTTSTVSAVTGNISKKRSGSVNVDAIVSGSTSQAATVTVTIKRDGSGGTAICQTMQAITTAAGPFNIPDTCVDTLPDTSTHTYYVQGVASAGTITTASNGIAVKAIEF